MGAVSMAAVVFTVEGAMAAEVTGNSIALLREGNFQQITNRSKKMMCVSGTTVEAFFGPRITAEVVMVLVVAVVVLVGGYFQFGFAQQRQKTFSSAEEATRALFIAVQARNDLEVMNILGAGNELVSTGDSVQDKLESEQFVQKYQEMHRLVRELDKTTVLYVGAENWPFPIPLVSRKGVWRFDAQAGNNEVLCRRIGDNEAMAIGAFRLLVLAQQEHLATPRNGGSVPEYATRFIGVKDAYNVIGVFHTDKARCVLRNGSSISRRGQVLLLRQDEQTKSANCHCFVVTDSPAQNFIVSGLRIEAPNTLPGH